MCVQDIPVLRNPMQMGTLVNTSVVPTCFTCMNMSDDGVTGADFLINRYLVNLNVNVTMTENKLIVSNFDSFPQLLDGVLNEVHCFNYEGYMQSTIVYTLSKYNLSMCY